MRSNHEVSNVEVNKESISLTIDGKNYLFPLSGISPLLQNASKVELERFEISPSGYGIHWPLLDEDISIDGLLGIVHRAPSKLAA